MCVLPALAPFTGEEDDNFEKGVEVLDETGRLAGSMTMSVAGMPNNDSTADLPHSERGSESLPLLHLGH